MTVCPYCGVRQEIDLKTVNFRDLGPQPGMHCPRCATALDMIEIEIDPPVQIERCQQCCGMFFNPGELEHILESGTSPLIWLDNDKLDQLGAEKARMEREIVYHQCPLCAERMHHVNFGGRSGVILDECGHHGVWLDGGELRQLKEWWHAGGKFFHQQHEAQKVRQFGIDNPAGGATPRPRPTTAGHGREAHNRPADNPGNFDRPDFDLPDSDWLEFAGEITRGLFSLFRR